MAAIIIAANSELQMRDELVTAIAMTKNWLKSFTIVVRTLSLLLCFPLGAMALTPGAVNKMPKELEGIGIFPNLGQTISLENSFKDESGKTIQLGKYFDGRRPVVVIMAYYGCPMLCGLLLNAAREAFQAFEWKIGDNYDVITVSIDPKEDSDLAMAKKASILEAWQGDGRKGAELGWHFLTGSQAASEKLAAELGFRYRLNPENGQYAHGPGIFFLSPKGQLSRVLFGIEYSPKDLKLALLEASEGKIGTLAEKIMMFCYSYDPKANKYALLATRVMKAGGGATVLIIVLTYLALFFRERTSKLKG